MNFIQHLRKINSILQTTSSLADDYNNPTGKGDFREFGISEILKDKLPNNLVISKGEVMDSANRRTPEFDMLISLSSETPKYFSLGERVVLPCEDLLMVGEIKSSLSEKNLAYFVDGVKSLNNLERFYKPTQVYQTIDAPSANSFKGRAIRCSEIHKGIGKVGTFFFSYKSPSNETIIKHLNSMDVPDNFIGVFTLGQSQIIRIKGVWTASPESQKDDVIFWLLFSIINYCASGERSINLNSDLGKYFDAFLKTEAARIMAQK